MMPKNIWGKLQDWSDKFWEKLENTPSLNKEVPEFDWRKHQKKITIIEVVIVFCLMLVLVWAILTAVNNHATACYEAEEIIEVGAFISPVRIHHTSKKYYGIAPKAYTLSEYADKFLPLQIPDREFHHKNENSYYAYSPYNGTDEDYYYLLCTIVGEAQCCSWEEQIYVASVVLNRVKSKRFNTWTIKDTVLAPNQYDCFWGEHPTAYREPTEMNEKAAQYVLDNGSQLPDNVVFQALFEQGDGIYLYIEDTGTYFCYLENY